MTSTTNEGGAGYGASASEAILPEGAEGISAILAMLAERSVDHLGGLDMDSRSLAMLRSDKKREKALRDLVITMVPDRINPAIWMSWLRGGSTPFDRAKITTPATPGVGISRVAERQSKVVVSAASAVQSAQRNLDGARQKLQDAERVLAIARAKDASVIEYLVSAHLLGIMAPMFSMGPAWTIMRAVSSHLEAAALDAELKLIRDPKRREERAKALRTTRQEGTNEILDVLDQWSGNVDFEFDLREAIEAVVKRYSGMENPDPSKRTRAAMSRGVRDPELVRDRDEILDGMQRMS